MEPPIKVVEIYEAGPRKVTRIAGYPAVYLPSKYKKLIGKNVIVILKLIETG